MKLNNKAKETIERLHLTSGLSRQDARKFFESLFILIVMDYLDENKRETHFPFIGDLTIEHIKDIFDGDLKKAILDIRVIQDDYLSKNIGQAIDGSETDAEDILRKRIHSALDDHVENK